VDFVPVLGRACLKQVCQIGSVHRQYQIEGLEICLVDLPCPLP